MDRTAETSEKRLVVRPRDLSRLAERLPACMRIQACGGREADLQSYFRYSTFIWQFGERIVRIAGLAACALYVHMRRKKTDTEFPRDPHFEDCLREVVFGRGYDRGLACAVLQRAGIMQSGPFKEIVDDDRPVTRFISNLPGPGSLGRPSNLLRAELRQPFGNSLLRLLEHLSFLYKFSFSEDGHETMFLGDRVELLPFLLWDGKVLRQFATFLRETREIVFHDFRGSGVELREPARGIMRAPLDAVAGMLRLPAEVFDGKGLLEDQTLPSGLMFSVADTHPGLTRLVPMLWGSATDTTRVELWLSRVFDSQKARENARTDLGTRVGCDEITRQCLDEDPISVLEDLYRREPDDAREHLGIVLDNEAEAEGIWRELNARVDSYRAELTAFYCARRDREDLEQCVRRYSARLYAHRIAKEMKFPLIELRMEEDIDSCIQRVDAFLEYLTREADDPLDPGKVRDGLVGCSNLAERILAFLTVFYRAIPYYDRDCAAGLPPGARAELSAFRSRPEMRGFGKVIGQFKRIGDEGRRDKGIIGQALWRVLEREQIWPGNSHERPFEALSRLNRVRVLLVHEPKPPSYKPPDRGEALEVVRGFKEVLTWLRDPTGEGRDLSPWRIYPAVVGVNLVSRTRSGLSSLKYVLVEPGPRRQATLYTPQQVSVEKYYYALPHVRKASPGVWHNPLLIQTDMLSDDSPGASGVGQRG